MFRKSILWLHRWTGLAITAFIIVMAVTGTNPEAKAPSADTAPASTAA